MDIRATWISGNREIFGVGAEVGARRMRPIFPGKSGLFSRPNGVPAKAHLQSIPRGTYFEQYLRIAEVDM